MPLSPAPAQPPAGQPASDRGALLRHTGRVAHGTHRCLAVYGHVDDLLLTPDGRALRLPELLAVDGAREGVVASEMSGASTLTPPDSPQPSSPAGLAAAPLSELLERSLGQLAGRRSTLLLQGAHSAAEQDDLLAERLRNLPFDRRLADGATQVVVSFRDDTLAMLHGATGWEAFHLSLPDRAERRSALGYWARIGVVDPASIDLDDLAATTGGLELDDLRRLVEEHARIQPLAPRRISEVRSAALTRQFRDLIRVDHHPAISFGDVVGGEAVKAAVRQARREGRFTPLALAGPPGVCKTMLGQAVARELGIPIAYVDGRLKGGIVGETARNLARFREMLVAYAPVVVFWDEIDLLLGRSTDWNGDSGASNEVRQAILTLLQDAPGLGIFVVASTNNPVSAMQYRVRNRFHIIPVLHPAGDDALAIARLEAAKHNVVLSAGAADLFLSTPDVLWNGRDIERVIQSARSNVLRLADPAHDPVARGDTLTLGAADLRMLIRHLAAARDEAAELNGLEAVSVVDNPCDLPWIARQIEGRPRPPLPAYLAEVIGADGLPDRPSIAARLAAAGVRDAR
jgi:ATPase family protein associated with various cellular activities (AAA)